MADYYAETYFGLIVSKEDFFDTNSREVDCENDDCPLERRPADLFCGKCGKGRSEKRSQVTEETVHPHLVGYEPFANMDDDCTWEDLLNEYEPTIKGLQLRWLRTSSMDEDPAVFLGVRLHRVSGEGYDTGPESMSMWRVIEVMDGVVETLLELGFDPERTPSLYTVCYCSV